MPDQCPKCGVEIPVGTQTCPTCSQTAPSQPRAVTVVAAALLPVMALVVFLGLAGGAVLVLAKLYHVINRHSPTAIVAPRPPPTNPPPAPTTPPPPATIPPMPADPVAEPPAPPIPSAAPIPPVQPVVPPPEAVIYPEPQLDDFVPPIAAPGSKLVLRGLGLAAVDHVQLISSHGAASVEATIVHARDDQLIVTVPKVPFENDPLFLLVRSPGGVAIMADQHMGNTPWGTDGHLHDTAVNVRPGDEIDTRDNMIVTAQEGSTVSVGDHSLALLGKGVTLQSHGKNCTIYYVAPVELAPGVSRDGMTEVPSIQVNTSMDAFRVKPAPPDSNP